MKPLLERIEKGQIDPTYIISHRITLDQAPEMYEVWRVSPPMTCGAACAIDGFT